MNSACPHFVRCIKPNTAKLPDKFTPEYVIAQLRYTGIMETTRIRQLGYPLRLQPEEFLQRSASHSEFKQCRDPDVWVLASGLNQDQEWMNNLIGSHFVSFLKKGRIKEKTQDSLKHLKTAPIGSCRLVVRCRHYLMAPIQLDLSQRLKFDFERERSCKVN